MSVHKFTMGEKQALNVHKVVASHIEALKNWAMSAVERGDLEYAQRLTVECREYEALYAAFNLTAKKETAKITGKEVATEHLVPASRNL